MKTTLTPEYFALKAFYAFVADRWFAHIPVPLEQRPVAVLERFEKSTPGKATASLRMAVNDLIEMSSHMQSSELAALNSELAAAGLLTFTQIRARYSKKLFAILKRGVIRNEVEYYLLHGVVVDMASGIAAQDRVTAEHLCSVYETKVATAP